MQKLTAPITPESPAEEVAPLHEAVAALARDGLVDTADLAAAKLGTKRAWLVVGTDDNTSGDGLVVPCQGAARCWG